MLVEGQILGNVVKGLDQALYEDSVYDFASNLLTSTLSDYAFPSLVETPRIKCLFTYNLSVHNPIGVKWVG
ncbi:molybdopterin cofactor-binding domain-containing protein [Oxyplasma meridianum]|uniref:molybdopterin cofactor-binding domain-containing protein n=1 Tax=Oxyplasma meridianum TaxID=3073602 RepID=UPI00372D2FFE